MDNETKIQAHDLREDLQALQLTLQKVMKEMECRKNTKIRGLEDDALKILKFDTENSMREKQQEVQKISQAIQAGRGNNG